MRLIYSKKIDAHHEDIILVGIHRQAKGKKNLEIILPFSFSYIDNEENFIAGINGVSIYGGMHIDSLFVNENSRGKEYGTILIKKAEELASKRNCSFCCLGTMGFEAKPFFMRN